VFRYVTVGHTAPLLNHISLSTYKISSLCSQQISLHLTIRLNERQLTCLGEDCAIMHLLLLSDLKFHSDLYLLITMDLLQTNLSCTSPLKHFLARLTSDLAIHLISLNTKLIYIMFNNPVPTSQ
jgi:hypothetical protein